MRTEFISMLLGAGLLAAGLSEASEQRPNVVILFADDMGYGDPSCYGGRMVKTPHIDQLAAEGLRLTDGYMASAVCGPSRTALLTGAYTQRFGVYWNPDTTKAEIPAAYRLLPQVMHDAGYVTGVIGKWNITRDAGASADEAHDIMVWGGNYWPNEGNIYPGVGGGWGDDKQQGIWGPCTPGEEYLTDRLTGHACRFIEKHADTPFFLYLAYNAPHSPLQAQQKYRDAVAHIQSEPERLYAAMVLALDAGVGRVMKTLKDKGLDERTVVFFMSDNGPARGGFKGYKEEWPRVVLGSTGGLRGHKGSLYEGGVRVPFIIRWPDVIRPGRVSGEPVIALDLMPTCAALAGVDEPVNPAVDGVDLRPLLKGGSLPRRTLFWAGYSQRAVRKGDWKLVESGDAEPELFNLADDPSESQDIAADHPEAVAALRQALQQWLAPMPPHQPRNKTPIIQPPVEQPLKPLPELNR